MDLLILNWKASSENLFYIKKPFYNEIARLYFRIDLDEDLVKIKLYLPHLYMKSKYEMKGRVLVMPIAGKGLCKGNYSE